MRAPWLPAAVLLLALAGPAGVPAQTGLANPASVNCAREGGTLRIERRGDGGQYGVCEFADNRQCEEWALLRGSCPSGGVRVIGYGTAAARYCAITGGRYAVTANDNRPDEQGSCALPGGKVCDAVAYHAGRCGP